MKVSENYVMSVCNEIDGYQRELYEAMMDAEVDEVIKSINKIRRTLSDIQKSYKYDEEGN